MKDCSRASKMAMKAAVETAGWLVVDWVDEMVGQMGACWDKRIVVMGVGSSAGDMAEKIAVKRVV